ncbi:MAG: transposase [Chitinophagales bacterium]|nr:transposase [Chitinophagales bacterium]
MSRKWKILDRTKPYFVSFAVVNWMDLFIRNEYRDILLDSLSFYQKKKGLEVHAWCIMSSHVHLIIVTQGNPMQEILRDFKSFTSRKLREAIHENPVESRKEWLLQIMYDTGIENSKNRGFQLWQQHNHPIDPSTNEMTDQRLHYTHFNPVESGFVSSPEDYLYSSARDYAGEQGLLKITLLD